ncbi:MAG: hypothetical protein D6805_05150 [Planctomycetota bacterium]|nr:MAG: hypothetical protein D6805_05150 [Planctomycetota bacterium]
MLCFFYCTQVYADKKSPEKGISRKGISRKTIKSKKKNGSLKKKIPTKKSLGKTLFKNQKFLIIIANKSMKNLKLTQSQIRKIFLKKSHYPWFPIDRDQKQVKKAFLKYVLRLDRYEWEDYWLKQATLKGVRPPAKYKKFYTILKLVSRRKNAISYYFKKELSPRRKKRYKVFLKKIRTVLILPCAPKK